MTASLWDSRFKAGEFVYGTDPNVFFKEEIDKLQAGKILLPGEGEGRNAIYAAKLQWEVDAFDWSTAARDKALRFAADSQVTITYTTQKFEDFTAVDRSYDAIALIFIHIPEEIRETFFKELLKALAPGGTFILFVYHKNQLQYGTGGPKEENWLYSLEEVISYFISLDFLTLSQETITLHEGSLHNGTSEVIKFVGRKALD